MGRLVFLPQPLTLHQAQLTVFSLFPFPTGEHSPCPTSHTLRGWRGDLLSGKLRLPCETGRLPLSECLLICLHSLSMYHVASRWGFCCAPNESPDLQADSRSQRISHSCFLSLQNPVAILSSLLERKPGKWKLELCLPPAGQWGSLPLGKDWLLLTLSDKLVLSLTSVPSPAGPGQCHPSASSASS